MQINRKRKKRRENETEKERVTWTAANTEMVKSGTTRFALSIDQDDIYVENLRFQGGEGGGKHASESSPPPKNSHPCIPPPATGKRWHIDGDTPFCCTERIPTLITSI